MEELARTLAELGIEATEQQPEEGAAAEPGDEKKKKKKEKKKSKAENEAPAEATNGAAAAAPAPGPAAAEEEEEETVPVDPAEVRFSACRFITETAGCQWQAGSHFAL